MRAPLHAVRSDFADDPGRRIPRQMRIQKIQFSNQEGKAGYVSHINKIEDSVKGVLGVPLQEAVAQFRPPAGEVPDFSPFRPPEDTSTTLRYVCKGIPLGPRPRDRKESGPVPGELRRSGIFPWNS